MKRLITILLALFLLLSLGTAALAANYGKVSDWARTEVDKAVVDDLYPSALTGADLTLPITRAEFAAVAVRLYEKMSGKTAQPAPTTTFTDTTNIDVLKAYSISVTDGTGSSTFSPNSLLNREEAATMLTRVYKAVFWVGWSRRTINNDDLYTPYLLDSSVTTRFADDSRISTWARDSVYFMFKKGIINGMGNNTFAPNNQTAAEISSNYANCTREQALIIAERTLRTVGSSGNATQYRALIGRVVNSVDKSVVQSASIKLLNSAGTQVGVTTTNAGGIFSFTNLVPGNYIIDVSATDYTAATMPQFTISSANITHVILSDFALIKTGAVTGATVTGRVSDSVSGANIPGASLLLRDSLGRQMGTAVSSAAGVYSITGVTAGYYTLEVTVSGYAALTTTQFYSGGSGAVTQNITLQAVTGGAVVTGTVKNASGAAISGASLLLRDASGRQWGAVTTSSAGVYSISGVAAGSYTLEVSASGYTSYTTSQFYVSGSGSVTQNVTLQTSAAGGTVVTGSVTSASTGAVIPGASLILRNSGGAQTGSAVTSSAGIYSISGAPAGYYTLEVSASGYTSYTTSQFYVSGSGSVSQNVTLQTSTTTGGTTLTGTVTNSVTGGNIAGASVVLKNSSGSQVGSAVTTTAGTYSIPGAVAGYYTLTVTASSYTTYTTSQFYVTGAGTYTQNISLQSAGVVVNGATINGRVFDSGYASIIANAPVSLKNASGTVLRTSTSSADGYFTFTGLSAGTYTVEVSASGYVTASKSVAVSGNNSFACDVTLTRR